MACLLGTIIFPYYNAFGSKKKLTLSAESKKYLFDRCFELFWVDPNTVIVYGVGSYPSTNLLIYSIADVHLSLEMKFLMTVYP